jgi:hypothetical protein
LHTEQLRGFDPAVPGNDLLIVVDQDGVAEAKSLDAPRDLAGST